MCAAIGKVAPTARVVGRSVRAAATKLKAVEDELLAGNYLNDNPLTANHAEWAKGIALRYPEITKENISDIVRGEVGRVFEQVLLDAGVFKRNESGREAFDRFLHTLTIGGKI